MICQPLGSINPQSTIKYIHKTTLLGIHEGQNWQRLQNNKSVGAPSQSNESLYVNRNRGSFFGIQRFFSNPILILWAKEAIIKVDLLYILLKE